MKTQSHFKDKAKLRGVFEILFVFCGFICAVALWATISFAVKDAHAQTTDPEPTVTHREINRYIIEDIRDTPLKISGSITVYLDPENDTRVVMEETSENGQPLPAPSRAVWDMGDSEWWRNMTGIGKLEPGERVTLWFVTERES